MDLLNKVAVITGAGGGIGSATADFLSQRGASVVVADVNGEAANHVVRELISKGRNALAVKVDVRSESSVSDLVKTVLNEYGKIDILVNNAGIINSTPIPELALEEWQKVLDINLSGAFLCTKLVITEMMKRRSGKIIYISSMAGQVGGLKVSPDYTASKAGLVGIAKSFARYGAPYGINVNAVAPGFVETEMTRGRDNPDSVPLGRLGTPEDVAKTVYFLASPLSDYITGATIDVNGGLLMR